MKFNKIKYTVIALLSAIFALSFAFALVFTASAERKLAVNYFNTFGMIAEEASAIPEAAGIDDVRASLLLTGGAGAYAQADNISGEYSIELRAYALNGGSGRSVVKFIDSATGDGFGFVVDTTLSNPSSVYVTYGGKTGGIYYFSYWENYLTAKPIGITSGKNLAGIFTELYGNEAITVRFDPESMCVYASNESIAERLVWDFSKEYNDGATLNKTFNPFSNYSVKIEHIPDESDMQISTAIYSINGTAFRNTVLDKDKNYASYVYPEYVGKTNENYVLPKPAFYGVADGNISPDDITVSVAKNGNVVLNSTPYSEGLLFTPVENGEYTVTYSYKGSENVKTITVRDYFDQTDYEFDYIPNSSYVSGETLVLPVVKNVISDRLINGVNYKAQVTLLKDGVPVENLSDLDAGLIHSVTLESGNYALVYTVKKPVELDSKTFNFCVTDNGAYLDGGNVNSVYAVGQTLIVPSAKILSGANSVDAAYKLIYPSGSCYTNENSVLSEAGKYQLVYTGVIDEKTYNFTRDFEVVTSLEDMFTVTKATVYNGSATLNDSIKGLVVEANNGNSIVYNNVIDLSDNTEDDLILELIADPARMGVRDFDQMRITLTDVHDPENVVTILFHATIGIASGDCAGTIVYVKAGFAGQSLKGYDVVKEEVVTSAAFGYACPMSLDAMFYALPADKQTFQLYYDNEQKAIFSSTSWADNQDNSDKVYSRLVADLDDYSFFENPWQGFTTGEVILTIAAEKMVSNSARYVITSVDGNSLAQSYVVDKKAPIITVNQTGNVSLGKLGAEYVLPTATAKDDFDGNVKTTTRVYYELNKYNVEVDVNDNKFIPTMAGEYSIVYTAVDNAGNVGTQILTVQVKDTLEPLSLSVNGQITAGEVGKNVQLGEFVANGGSQKYTLNVSVTIDGKECTIIDGKFLPIIDGVYTVKCVATDYLGATAEKVYTITVSKTDKPILTEEPTLPAAFINGFEYVIDIPVALDYNQISNGKAKEIVPVLKAIYGGTQEEILENGKFIADVLKGEIVDLVYIFDGAVEDLEYKITVPIINPFGEEDTVMLSKYFVTDKVDAVVENDTDIGFTFNQSGASIEFANPVFSKNMTLNVGVGVEKYAYDSFTIKIIDSKDENVYLSLKIKKEVGQNYSTLIINDLVSYKYTAPFEENDAGFSFKYNNETRIVSGVGGVKFMKFNTDALGNSFSGFSQKVLISVTFDGVSGESEFLMKNINGQNFTNMGYDYGAPVIEVLSDYGGRHLVGEDILVPAAVAYDVLSSVGTVKVSVMNNETGEYVMDKNGAPIKNVNADKEYTFTATARGVFKISYKVSDAFGNPCEDYKLVRVSKDYEFSGDTVSKVPSSTKVGKTVQLPEFIPTGIEGEYTVKIIAIAPSGAMSSVDKNSFVFDSKGDWTIRYLVYDDDFNYIIREYQISVS